MVKLKIPVPIYGINGCIYLTHSGKLKNLPEINKANRAYYSKSIDVTLISLGYIQARGGSYSTTDTSQLDIYLPDHTLLESASMGSNMTYTMSPAIRSRDLRSLPTAYTAITPPASQHVNAEQRNRCDLVQDLIVALGFPSDASLSDDLRYGKITYKPYNTLTPHDVELNRRLRKECPHAAAGKHRSAPHPSSTSPPCTQPGEVISFDIQLLPDTAPGGFTHAITFADEHSGRVDVVGARSKSTAVVLAASIAYLEAVYKANGHTVSVLHGDDEAINRSLAPEFARSGITIQLSPPGEHARRVERYIQTIGNRVLAVISYLPYELPSRFALHCQKAVAAMMNDSINSRSHPLTPNEVIMKKKPARPPVPFGSCWNVSMSALKRRALANKNGSTPKHVPKVEVGVCLGPCARTTFTRFVLENGEVVSRIPVHPLPDGFVPFNWPAKKVAIRMHLPSTAPNPDHLIIHPPLVPHHDLTTAPPNTDLTTDPPATDPTPAIDLAPAPPTPPAPPAVTPPPPPRRPPTRLPVPPLPAALSSLRSHLSRRAHVPPGGYALAAASSESHIDRKLVLSRLATARNKAFRSTLDLGDLSNKPTNIQPNPDRYPARQEVKFKTAVAQWDRDDVIAAFHKEVVHKQFGVYDAIELIAPSEIESNAIRLKAAMYYKKKLNGTISGRMPADGSRQPPDSYSSTYAATSDQTNGNLLFSALIRDMANKGTIEKLRVGHFDLPAAFINGNPLTRDKTGGRQVVMRLPHDLPDASLSNRWVLVKQCLYGMKQSNHEFDKAFDAFLTSIGYQPLPSDTRIYIKRAPDGTLLAIKMHVDDGAFISDNDDLIDELEAALRQRYGEEVTFSRDSDGVCSVRVSHLPTHDIKLDVGPYIQKFLHKCGMDDVPPALTPSLPGLFAAPLDDTPLTPAEKHDFQVVTGGLVFLLPIRFDIALEVNFLCSRNHCPTASDRLTQIQLLRYLKGHPDVGPVFSSAPGPIEIVGSSDASHAVHVDGASHTGHTLSIGADNAAFSVTSVAERSSVSPDAMSAEYKSLGRLAKKVIYFRQLLIELGFPQPDPTILQTDSQSSISLVVAPQVTRKSRHIFIQHHFIRSLAKHGHIRPVHVGTNDIASDMLTKQLSPNKFFYGRARLFNTLPPTI